MPKGYPSEELIERYYEAYKKDGESGIKSVLQEQQNKRAYIRSLAQKHLQKKAELQSQSKENPKK